MAVKRIEYRGFEIKAGAFRFAADSESGRRYMAVTTVCWRSALGIPRPDSYVIMPTGVDADGLFDSEEAALRASAERGRDYIDNALLARH